MSKQIVFEFEGKDYALEFTRKSVETMERQGFDPDKISERPLTMLPALFSGAFIANHSGTKRKVIDSIFEKMKGKKGLLTALVEMYNEPIEALLEDEEDDGKNVEWEQNF